VQIGRNFSVPDERLYPRLVDLARQIYEKFGTNETDSLLVAQLLGHASIGGAFNGKIAAMTSYGLVDRRLGKIRLTEIGRKALASDGGREKVDGVKSALFKVALWKRLYQDYAAKGAELPSNFWPDLVKITDISSDDAKSKAEWVAKAFKSDLSYLKSVENESGTLGTGQSQQKRAKSADAAGMMAQTPSGRASLESQPDLPPTSESLGQISFSSPVDRIELTVPRAARHMPMLRAFVEKALKTIDAELTAEARMAAEGERTKKTAGKR